MRVDQLLVERGLASSRAQAQRLIGAGVRWRDGGDWKTVARNRDEVPVAAELQLLDEAEARYVSRGGLKLEGALKSSGVAVIGKHCLDVGQSTGGFTDCLLQHGAAHVVGVDVGQNQVHQKVREDARVTCIEKLNAREMTAADLVDEEDAEDEENEQGERGDREPEASAAFDLIVGDLSFISQTLVLPALVPLLKADGALLMLVKPQFELQPGQVGKGGIVRDEAMYAVVQTRIRECYAALGLNVRGWYDSAITGGDGNREFFVYATRTDAEENVK